ncbi:Pectin lyase-like superfamily protein [Euphorbia peplus]|nr:Pectin lyase-like superfamily protein [Euphorbia peplus]
MSPIINYLTIPFFLLFLLGAIVEGVVPIPKKHVIDITKYGGTPSKTSYINQALMKAWKEACANPVYTEILIPKGDYLLGEIDLSGPCKAPIVLVIKGNLKAPRDLKAHTADYWIRVRYVNHFRITGGGTLDGDGSDAWLHNVCQKNPNCKNLPINLRLDFVDNGVVENIKSVDSKNFHINILECRNITIKRVTIQAPADSPNTDGIHLGRSERINIVNTTIGTGDDCISIGDDSSRIKIVDVICGPGHGISIGSLGKYKNEGPVTGVVVKRCTINNADNGLRIKTWPGMYATTASSMLFEDITMNNVSNPILIDQMYCPSNHCNRKTQSNVKVSKISFKGIRGTSFTPKAIQLICSEKYPCEEVDLGSINLKYIGKTPGPAIAECVNIKPKFTGKVLPAGC